MKSKRGGTNGSVASSEDSYPRKSIPREEEKLGSKHSTGVGSSRSISLRRMSHIVPKS